MTSPANADIPSRDELALEYLDSLEFEPYPFQEEAILGWFSSDQGTLVCAPTGMGKTLIAEAALFEAIKTGKTAYYTTPLIALTEQKFRDLQEAAVRWGFEPTDVGLVTGNRRENPKAKLLVVVAEILFNRLLHPEAFDFRDVSAVVMDEFHSFNDPERGIVWELTLALLPTHVRTLLLSATVGNAYGFVSWLRDRHHRKLQLIQSDERKVPLTFHWVEDKLLTEHLEEMAEGGEDARTTPALVFCFNREHCWTLAEQIKGKKLIDSQRQKAIVERIDNLDWSQGAGPKLRLLLMRGVGVHHAGVLPKYRRIVEELFQEKLLAITLCTETLAAGINLPARSVVLPTIMKGPAGKKRIVEPSSAHQIFGRAGRPQFDTRGHVFALAHEDDVKILRWREKYDQIPEDAKDPKMLQMKKKMKKKMPKRRTTEQYWSQAQFNKLVEAPSADLASRGGLPWRLLAYMLQASPETAPIRTVISKRLMDDKHLAKDVDRLEQMLLTLWHAGYVELEPAPLDIERSSMVTHPDHPSRTHIPRTHGVGATYSDVVEEEKKTQERHEHWDDVLGTLESDEDTEPAKKEEEPSEEAAEETPSFGMSLNLSLPSTSSEHTSAGKVAATEDEEEKEAYRAEFAHATQDLQKLLMLRSVNPLYGVFLINQLGIADRNERLLAFESVLELPSSIAHFVRPPSIEEMPPGPLATNRLDVQLLHLGLATPEELTGQQPDEEDRRNRPFGGHEDRVWALSLSEKLKRLFQYDYPYVTDFRTNAVWVAGELLEFGGDFNKYITSKKLQKQEGMIFRHTLRLVLVLKEFQQLCPPDCEPGEWKADLREIVARLSECCRSVDQSSTDEAVEAADALEKAMKEGDPTLGM